MRPNHMATIFDFPAPYCPLPDVEPISADDLEFSDLGRGKHSWSVVLLIFLAIFVPLVIALELWR